MKNNNYFYLLVFLFLNLFFFPVKSDPIFELGKTIFLEQGNCATCHTLADAKSNGEIGPNLDNLMPTLSQVMMAVKNGIGVMPSFDGILTSEEIEAVSYFVSEKAGKNN